MAVFVALLPVLGAFLLVLYLTPRLLSYWRYIRVVEKIPSAHGRIPLLGNAHQFAIPRNQIGDNVVEIHKLSKSPYVLWFGPLPFLVLTDPKHMEVILGSTKHLDKLTEYKFIECWLGKGLLTSTGSYWSAHRKLITPAFHFKILENFIDIFIEKSKILVEKIEVEIEAPSFDIYEYISRCAMDIICATAMGINVHAQEKNQQSDYVTAMARITGEIMHRGMSPWLYPEIIFKVSPNGRRVAKYVRTLHDKAYQIIKERKEQYKRRMSTVIITEEEAALGKKKKLAFLDLLLENSEKGMKLSDEEIREEVDTFMNGGHGTVTSLMSWVLQMFGSYPDVQEKAYEEQENIFKGSDRDPSSKDLCEMKYLERVIKETMRMYPIVAVMGRVLKEAVEVGGYRVPAGMRVIFVPYLTHNLEEYYPNPKVFDPDRFVPEKIANRHPYSFIPFSAGPRNCIGQKFAMLEVKTVLSFVIRHYKFEATGEIPKFLPEVIVRPENGIHLKMTRRTGVTRQF